MTCKDCAFVADEEHNLPRCSYPCLCCRDNTLFNLALKDCYSYYYYGRIPKNTSIVGIPNDGVIVKAEDVENVIKYLQEVAE